MKKLYVIIRKDLAPSYQAVQAGHAVAEWILKNPTQAQEWGNGYLIYVAVDSLEALEYWYWKLSKEADNCTGFREPDINNELTSIACFSDGKPFKRRNCLSCEQLFLGEFILLFE